MKIASPCIALVLLAGGSVDEARTQSTAAEPMTVITGTIREAVTRRPIINSVVYTNHSTLDTARTDSTGRFSVRVSRSSSLMGARKDGVLEFQFPVLNLTTDSLIVDIELRADPPTDATYSRPGFLPLLCVVFEGNRLSVTNSCADRNPAAGFAQKIIKHNPWSLYFGPAGDRGGVMLRTRIAAASESHVCVEARCQGAGTLHQAG